MRHLLAIAAGLFAVVGCARSEPLPPVVQPFVAERYLGVWYEQVRYDHFFERGLESVSATYGTDADGDISVLNRGWNAEKNRWSEAAGYAKFAGATDQGHLRVTFFWPFFGDYRILYLDPEYSRVIIAGPDRSWLWIMTRERYLPEAERAALIARAEGLGFARAPMILVRHDRAPR